jgi:hypothetical protein
VDKDCDQDAADLEMWSLAHVLGESMNPVSKEKVLTVRYEDGQQEDVCEGAVHRPGKARRLHIHPSPIPPLSRSGTSAVGSGLDNSRETGAAMLPEPLPPRGGALGAHVCRCASPPPAREGHASSLEESSENTSDEETLPDSDIIPTDSDAAISEPRVRQVRRRLSTVNVAVREGTNSSEATISECGSGARPAGRPQHMSNGVQAGDGGAPTVTTAGPLQPQIRSARVPLPGPPHGLVSSQRSNRADGLGASLVYRNAGPDVPAGSLPTMPSSSDSWYHAPERRQKQVRRQACRSRKRRAPRHDNLPPQTSQVPTVDRTSPSRSGNQGSEHNRDICPQDDLAQRFAPSTWENNGTSYGSQPLECTGPEPGCTYPYGCLPSLLGLFDKFWSLKLQRRIVRESNRYTSEVIDEKVGKTRGGLSGHHYVWKNFEHLLEYVYLWV